MDHTTSDLKNISNHFQKVSWKGDSKFTCCCPVHNDRTPSAYVELKNGWINLNCSSGCELSELRAYIKDLGYNKNTKPGPRSTNKRKKKPAPRTPDGYKMLMPVPKKHKELWTTHMHKMFSEYPEGVNPGKYIYAYFNLEDKPLMFVTRKEDKEGKKYFLPHTFWENQEGRVRWDTKAPIDYKPLYIQKITDKLSDIKIVHIYEGEKTTNAGRHRWQDSPEILHVSWLGGSKTWTLADWNHLKLLGVKGAEVDSVVLFPDNDKVGYQAMEGIAWGLPLIFKTRDIKILDFRDKPEGWDIADIDSDEEIAQLTEAYINAELAELPIVKEFTYVREVDSFYDWDQQLFYKSDHFNRILMTDAVFDENNQRIESSKKFIEAKGTDKAHKITFDPQEKKKFSIGGTVYVNSYVPFVIEPVPGDTAWLDEFFEYIAPDPHIRKYLLQWIAHNIRYPGVKIMTAILIYGVEGTGKGTVYQLIKAMLGKEYVKQVREEQFKDKFTEHLYKRIVLCIDEIKVDYSNRVSMMNKLKNLITEDEFTVDMKGMRPFETKNVVNFLLLTNHDNAITINERSRRFFVFGIDKDPMPGQWYKNIYYKIRTEPGVIKDYFDKVDLSDFDKFAPAPKTKFFNEVVENTKGEDMRMLDTYYEELRWPFTDCNFVCIADLQKGFERLKIRVSLKLLQDWVKSKGGDKIGQIRFGKQRPVIWYIDPNKPRPTELKDIARYYLEPYWPSGEFDTDNYYHLDYVQRRQKDGLAKLDEVSHTKTFF